MKKSPIALAIHGGAGSIVKAKMSAEREAAYRKGLEEAMQIGYERLNNGKTATDVVEWVVSHLEDNPLFNAGRGSVFNAVGKHEMDAAIMDGSNLKAGSVSGVSNIKNPIHLARLIMDKSQHVMLFGKGAENFATSVGCQFEKDEYFYNEHRYKQWQKLVHSNKIQLDHSDSADHKFGTVGAVALDMTGNLAAATSSGGMTNKKYGRIGDSSIIGAGTYANNATCAVSCTGNGEYFIRNVVAYDLSTMLEHTTMSLQQACQAVIQKRLAKFGGKGGLIAIDKYGNIGIEFNTSGMFRAWKSEVSEGILMYEK